MPAPPHPHPCTHRESHAANAEIPAQILPDAGRKPDFNAWLETLAHAPGVFASEAVVRSWSILYPCSSSSPIPTVSGCPGESSRLISRAQKFLCTCKKNCWRVLEIRAIFR
jgi:hypothetical protein